VKSDEIVTVTVAIHRGTYESVLSKQGLLNYHFDRARAEAQKRLDGSDENNSPVPLTAEDPCCNLGV